MTCLIQGTERTTVNECINANNLSEFWCDHDCNGAFSRELNNSPGNVLKYNPSNVQFLQRDVNTLFKNYNNKGYKITNDKTSSSYSPFQETLLLFCLDPRLPGICDSQLKSQCKNYTREQAYNNPTITDWCGCYIEPDPLIIEKINNPACDTLCNRVDTIKKSDLSTGEIERCSANVCVISDNSISLNQTNVGGNVTFANLCPSCGLDDGCFCVLSGNDLNNTLSTIGVNKNSFQQLCGNNSICYQDDKIVECGTLNPDVIKPPLKKYLPSIWFMIIVFAILIIVIIMFILMKIS